MNLEDLIPIEGCWVRQREPAQGPLGQVLAHRKIDDVVELRVAWDAVRQNWIPLANLRSGFQLGWTVQDVPISATRKPLGQGSVIGRRELGGREQLLVQLDWDGRSVWLPYENLRRLKDCRVRYVRAETGVEQHSERFRLKVLAHALENWNYLTGSLDRLDVDPLPHQIQLVHRILSSGNYNWLIADDVGLGKTIEVGLLLAALKRKNQAKRVLVVSPAGLTRQWQDELHTKFDQQYQIYGRDFVINQTEHWKLHDNVIVSIDLAKRDDHMLSLRQAGSWDVVVFDEGHKLTRYSSGERAQRYKLAETLRPLSDAFLLLSGTPHQGYADRFIALLELVRPDLRQQLHTLESNPEIVGEMILRNRKSEVTDVDGSFIFRGHKVHRVPVTPSEETRIFQTLLRDYLRRGYKAGASAGAPGRAIGFVMTTYRKLASSSIAAIEHALELRRDRLLGESENAAVPPADDRPNLEDLSQGGDDQDDLANDVQSTAADEFFAFERDLIDGLLASAMRVREQDEKLRVLLDQIVQPLVAERKKLLVFTEYRATQRYLQRALESIALGEGDVLLINGSMSLDEKLSTIQEFNAGTCRFLISTEAGGEGLNLHKACHVMVNYDLPWNPARLIQRIGRLYRYGQKETVVVFNLHARDSFDNAAIDLMLGRVAQIVQDMAPVGTDYNDRLYAEILGDILDHLDFAAVLQSATSMEIERTREQIDDAVERAQRAKRLQDEIFSHVVGFDPAGLSGALGFTMRHVECFIRGMLPVVGAVVEEELYGGQMLQIRLPEDLRGQFTEFANRTIVRVTADRNLAVQTRDSVLLDFDTQFFQHLIRVAQSQAFDGIYATVRAPDGKSGKIGAFKLRWQNDQGEPLTEDLLSVFAGSDGVIEVNPPFLAEWLANPFVPQVGVHRLPAERGAEFDELVKVANMRLGVESTRFKHPNGLVQLAAADFNPSNG